MISLFLQERRVNRKDTKSLRMTREQYNELAKQVVDSCFQVHVELGPGLLESAYEFALLKEFELRNIKAANQVPVKLFYKGFIQVNLMR